MRVDGLMGLLGLVYVLSVMHRTRRLDGYVADIEDRVCYTFLPFSAYAAIFVGAIILRCNPVNAVFVVAAASYA